ncbi:MAG: single-stranded DNA-binding protein [Planctomycetota bacterium]|nr:single-stranded DNA-binding protein [Planctomycetota bacterium]
MANINIVILAGNLTRDPEMRYTPSGTAVTTLGLAINRRYRDSKTNEWREDVTFVDVDLFSRQAEIASQYLSKGRPVLIEGSLRLDQWEDRQTGQKRSKLKVIGNRMQFIGGRGDGGPGGGGGGGGGAARPPRREGGAPPRRGAPRDQPPPPQDQDGPPPEDVGQDLDIPEDDIPF